MPNIRDEPLCIYTSLRYIIAVLEKISIYFRIKDMDQFISLLPEGKAVSCIEDFSILTVKELKKVLLSYKEKVSGAKADLILGANAVFSRLEQQEISALKISEPVLVGVDAECTYNAISGGLRAFLSFSYIAIW